MEALIIGAKLVNDRLPPNNVRPTYNPFSRSPGLDFLVKVDIIPVSCRQCLTLQQTSMGED